MRRSSDLAIFGLITDKLDCFTLCCVCALGITSKEEVWTPLFVLARCFKAIMKAEAVGSLPKNHLLTN